LNAFTRLVLPQNDTPQNRVDRQKALQQQQGKYRYDYPAIVAGLPMAATPIPVDLSIGWAVGVAGVALGLGANLVDLVLPNLVDVDPQIPITLGSASAPPSAGVSAPARALLGDVEAVFKDVEAVFKDVKTVFKDVETTFPPESTAFKTEPTVFKADADLAAKAVELSRFLKQTRTDLAKHAAGAAPPTPTRSLWLQEHGVVAFSTQEHGAVGLSTEPAPADPDAGARVFRLLQSLIDKLAEFLGELLGVYGRAGDVGDYDYQFRTLPLPWPAGVFQTDAIFAQMRVVGPNPGILRRAAAADLEGFALDDATYARVTAQPSATVAQALATGALYLVDYTALQALQPGDGKYVFAPRALFFVRACGRRTLRPVAVQIAPGAGPVYYPGDGTPWEIAKLLVNMADGNDHELVSHLGLTHLLTEPFVLATYRQLDPLHPLNALLAPHFAGTLLINYAAQTTLIVNGGAVDQLLTGTIESGRLLSANAVKAVRYNASFFPDTLVARGVADVSALPDYPYRDDALSLWNELHTWVTDYLAVYYFDDGDVAGDYELQAWVQELVSAGKIQDIGEAAAGAPPSIETRAYLARLLTQVIFTASVQHAAVNFPQNTIMAFTPAMPLAAYAPFPAAAGQPATQVLDVLPPLQRGLLQQAVGSALGGVHHTVLGQYGGQLALVQVQAALLQHQGRLQALERKINAANQLGARTPYTTLLPSLIPQSINI
jgi:arachidonate 15-lipoxygenase